MTKQRFTIKGSRVRDNESDEPYLTLKECVILLNKLDKDNKLMIATLREYDGKWLFDGSILSFAEVLNKLNEEKL